MRGRKKPFAVGGGHAPHAAVGGCDGGAHGPVELVPDEVGLAEDEHGLAGEAAGRVFTSLMPTRHEPSRERGETVDAFEVDAQLAEVHLSFADEFAK
jgi:hypothetical protein